jgi:excisionase family DNA binding protein
MARLNLSRAKVYDLIRTRQLTSVTVGRARRIPATAINTYIRHLTENGD